MKKRILVTGGAGFLGVHLCARLLELGHQVVCVDNFHTGRQEALSRLSAETDLEVIRHDVTSPLSVEVEQIYHLACPASPIHYQADPVRTTKTAVLGTINMLGLALRLNAPLFLASTSEVYGDPEVHPQPESYLGRVNCIGPRSCYDEGKRCAETLCFDYKRQYDLDVRVARIFNTYGPGMHFDDGRVVSNFIVQALKGQPLTIYGDGSQSRSFCYVSEMVDGFVSMMEPGSILNGPVNLGNPGEFTVSQLAESIVRLAGSSSTIEYRPLPVDDPVQRQPDISLAREKLGWNPGIDLESGLEKTIADFRRRMAEMTVTE